MISLRRHTFCSFHLHSESSKCVRPLKYSNWYKRKLFPHSAHRCNSKSAYIRGISYTIGFLYHLLTSVYFNSQSHFYNYCPLLVWEWSQCFNRMNYFKSIITNILMKYEYLILDDRDVNISYTRIEMQFLVTMHIITRLIKIFSSLQQSTCN